MRYKITLIVTMLMSAMAMGQTLIEVGAEAYSISTPWAEEDLFELQYVQANDIMYIVHNDYAPRQLSYYGDSTWSLETAEFYGGPFLPENTIEENTITPSAKRGTITLTATADTFMAGHVGGVWQIKHLVDANSIQGVFTGVVASPTLEVQQGRIYDFTTEGTWAATISLQRSYDGGSTWLEASRIFALVSGTDGQVHYVDEETEGHAVYRVNCSAYSSGEVGYTLSARAGVFGGVVEIDTVSDARTASATLQTNFALVATGATYRWAEGAWSDRNGYPGAVCFFQERLCFGGSKREPDTIWCSQTNDWLNHHFDGLATSAMRFPIASDQIDSIVWMAGHTSILIGTTGAEWALKGGVEKGLTFDNFDVSRQSTNGSARIQPVGVSSQIIYAQRNARKIYGQQFAFERDNWLSTDLTFVAEHITEGGITQMAYQRTPRAVLWAVRSDGTLLAAAMEESEDVIGWYRYTFGAGECESVAVISGAGEDQVWVIVARTIEGELTRFVEVFTPVNYSNQAEGFFVDSGLTFTGAGPFTITHFTLADPAVVTATDHTFSDGDQVRISAVSGTSEINTNVYTVGTVSGSTFELRDETDTVDINSVDWTAYAGGGSVEQVENTFATFEHLEAREVVAAGDGGYAGEYIVSDGTISLSDYYHIVHAGLAYTAKLKPMNLEFAHTGGALQGLVKRINATTIRFDLSLSCSIGPTWDDYDSYVFRGLTDPLGQAPPLFTGDKRILFDGPSDREGAICIQDSFPVPLTVVSIIAEYELGRE